MTLEKIAIGGAVGFVVDTIAMLLFILVFSSIMGAIPASASSMQPMYDQVLLMFELIDAVSIFVFVIGLIGAIIEAFGGI